MRILIAAIFAASTGWSAASAQSYDDLNSWFDTTVVSMSSFRVFAENCGTNTSLIGRVFVDNYSAEAPVDRDKVEDFVQKRFMIAKGLHSKDCNIEMLKYWQGKFSRDLDELVSRIKAYKGAKN
ncbi:MAG TPA: hypothetical protein VIL65_13925 [Beijerinckiaceae bacterium]|jgi:hypothetical protein